MQELVERRGRDHKVFDLGNGQRQVVLQRGLHYESAPGIFDECDTSLEGGNTEVLDAQTGERFTHSCVKNNAPVRMNKFKQPVKISHPDGPILIKPVGAGQAAGVASGNQVTYSDTWANVDCVRRATPEGLNETYILKAAGHPTRFEFAVPTGLGLLQGCYAAPFIKGLEVGERRDCPVTWTATGFYFDLPDVSDLPYPVTVE